MEALAGGMEATTAERVAAINERSAMNVARFRGETDIGINRMRFQGQERIAENQLRSSTNIADAANANAREMHQMQMDAWNKTNQFQLAGSLGSQGMDFVGGLVSTIANSVMAVKQNQLQRDYYNNLQANQQIMLKGMKDAGLNPASAFMEMPNQRYKSAGGIFAYGAPQGSTPVMSNPLIYNSNRYTL